MQTVKLPRDVSEALTHIVQTYDYPIRAVVEMFNGKSAADKDLSEYFEQDRSRRIGLIMQALVNGWEVEETPEDKVRNYFKEQMQLSRDYQDNAPFAIKYTMDLLGKKIEGVNA